MTLGGRTFPGIADEGIKQGPRANAGREGTPMLTVVNSEDPVPAGRAGLGGRSAAR